ncbi:MAG TPA: alpha/beta hydrolase [Desulfobacterales bacterium]|nr:alpha/beta hydrolase [Desulfobacterales bacterium]
MKTVCLRSSPPNGRILLSDGRRLSFQESGSADGHPVFYFHGFPGSRLETGFADPAAKRHSLRIIGVDRPGFGLSDFQPGRRLIDWPHDVTQLADALNIKRFAVLGVSGGGPYAAVCAFKIPSRLTVAGIGGGLGPIDVQKSMDRMTPVNRFGLYLSQKAPGLLRVIFPMVGFGLRWFPDRILDYMAIGAGKPDRIVLTNPRIRQLMCDTFRESVRSGYSGPVTDLIIYGRPWGFSLEEIPIPVYLWHGESDRIVPAGMGRYLARSIPECRPTFYAGEGHFSLVANRMEEILGVIEGLIRNSG